MKKSTKLLGGTLTLAIAVVAIASPALAWRGDPSVQGPDCSAERHEAMEEAFQNNNYAAWEELMNGKGRVTQVVDAGNFALFAEAHELAEDGNFEEAKTIRTELGLGLRDGSGKDQGQGENGQKKGSGRTDRPGSRGGNGLQELK